MFDFDNSVVIYNIPEESNKLWVKKLVESLLGTFLTSPLNEAAINLGSHLINTLNFA